MSERCAEMRAASEFSSASSMLCVASGKNCSGGSSRRRIPAMHACVENIWLLVKNICYEGIPARPACIRGPPAVAPPLLSHGVQFAIDNVCVCVCVCVCVYARACACVRA